MECISSSRLILYFMSRPIKSYWHGSGPVHHWTGAGLPSSSAPPGTCDQWQSDSSLGVGLATHSTDPTSHVLAPHRSAVFHVSLVCLTLLFKLKVSFKKSFELYIDDCETVRHFVRHSTRDRDTASY